MSNGSDSWNHSAVPLSIFSNGTPSHLGLAKISSSLVATDAEAKRSSYNASCVVLKERDYIGTWGSDQGLTDSAVILRPNFGAKASDLQPKDTELRLGLGPSLLASEDGLQLNSAQNVFSGEDKSDCRIVQINASKNCVSQQIPLPEQQHVATPQPISRKYESEQQPLPDHDGKGVLENAALIAPLSSSRAHVPQGPFPNRNGEQHQSFQRGSVSLQGKSYCIPDGSPNNPCQNDIPRLEAPHHVVSGQVVNTKALVGSSELRFAPHEVVASKESGNLCDVSPAQKFWQIQMSQPIEGYRSLPAQNASVSEVALAPGRYAVPVPKVCTVPAKRPFFDTIGEHSGTSFTNDSKNDLRGNAAAAGAPMHGGVSSGTSGALAIDGEAKYGASQAPKIHPASGYFPWTNVIQLPGGWQPMPTQFKAPNPAVPAHDQSNDAKISAKPGNNILNDNSGSRAVVVGWPPIRSFRKNTLAAHPKTNEEDPDVAGETPTTHYVKAKLDGAKVQRKVDLNSCSSHETLKLALQDLFEGFVNGHNGGSYTAEGEKFDLVHGSDYVIAYEDFEGDLMLAHDVPWEDFVTKVKRLRVMKASEAKVGWAKVGTHVNS